MVTSLHLVWLAAASNLLAPFQLERLSELLAASGSLALLDLLGSAFLQLHSGFEHDISIASM